MELRQVRYFLAVLDAGTFSAAAKNLNIVQSAVSQQIARLERELGTPLFDRSTRIPTPTAAGRRFAPAAERLLEAEVAARESVAPPSAGRVLRLGVTSGLDRRVSRLGTPVEAVTVPASERQLRVADGDIDAAIVHGTHVRPGLVGLSLRADRVMVVTAYAHPAAAAGSLRLADLRPFSLLLGTDAIGTALAHAVTRACRTVGFEPRVQTIAAGNAPFSQLASREGSWTVFYEDQSELFNATALGVRFLRPIDISLEVPTTLVVRADNKGLGVEIVRSLDSSV